jgi:GSH-dependent disulfide-bond oxidoreductase
MIDLHTAGTGNGQRASIILEECGLAYRAHKIDLAKGEQKSPEFLKLNPRGQIPVVVDSEGPGGKPLLLTQSGAIMLHYALQAGKFLPTGGLERTRALQWFMQAATDVGAVSGALFVAQNVLPEKSAANSKVFEDRLAAHFAACDRQLGETEYLAGAISVADLYLYPTYAARAELCKAAGLANLQRWGMFMAKRPGVDRGMKVPA